MIDKATVAQILDAADIVDVVSDFVSLRRRGSNYIGLCPFHNEKTPSFSVSRAKGICHCFSCGKGGSPVNFIMEHEQMSYYEALKYLAKKYHIEVKEKELTDQERAEQTEREGMLIVNEFAGKYFEDNLYNTQEGKDIGMSYFYERGFSDATIKKFHLGYSLERNGSLYKTSVGKGFNRQYLFNTGLCIDDNKGGGYDRFKGRVMFPILNIAGKVIAFGGRTLKTGIAKYINSPESIIYKKKKELYGLFQAKKAIVDCDKCFLVEGYTDVISMHQAGIENVVASSGTSLTEGQIRMIHRFTNNVTVLYDGDAAGIKASLRGIDMLLAEGLNIKVLLLPDGDDPDSFARKHNATEFNNYIKEHETDFIKFKIRILLDGVKDDPVKRAAVIGDVVKSIAVIPFEITQSVYIKECSQQLDIDESVLLREVKKCVDLNKQREYEQRQKAAVKNATEAIQDTTQPNVAASDNVQEDNNNEISQPVTSSRLVDSSNNSFLYTYEKIIIRLVVKYGMIYLCNLLNDKTNELEPVNVLEFVTKELNVDNIRFSNKGFDDIYNLCLSLSETYNTEVSKVLKELEIESQTLKEQKLQAMQNSFTNIEDIERKEKEIENDVKQNYQKQLIAYQQNFLERQLCSHPNDEIRKISIALVSDKHSLSKIHTRYASIQTEYERLGQLVPQALVNYKDAIIQCKIKDNQKLLSKIYAENRIDDARELLKKIQELYDIRKSLAQYLGDRVVNPKI